MQGEKRKVTSVLLSFLLPVPILFLSSESRGEDENEPAERRKDGILH
jgi:hypothetical protein